MRSFWITPFEKIYPTNINMDYVVGFLFFSLCSSHSFSMNIQNVIHRHDERHTSNIYKNQRIQREFAYSRARIYDKYDPFFLLLMARVDWFRLLLHLNSFDQRLGLIHEHKAAFMKCISIIGSFARMLFSISLLFLFVCVSQIKMALIDDDAIEWNVQSRRLPCNKNCVMFFFFIYSKLADDQRTRVFKSMLCSHSHYMLCNIIFLLPIVFVRW